MTASDAPCFARNDMSIAARKARGAESQPVGKGRKAHAGERHGCGKLKPAEQRDSRFAEMQALIYGACTAAIYVAWDGVSVKIGRTINIAARVRSLQTGHDRDICVFWAVRLSPSDAIDVEAAIHRHLRTTINHKRGEWYALDPGTAVEAVKAEVRRSSVDTREDVIFGLAAERFS